MGETGAVENVRDSSSGIPFLHPGDYPIIDDYWMEDDGPLPKIEPYGWYFYCADCDWYHGPFKTIDAAKAGFTNRDDDHA